MEAKIIVNDPGDEYYTPERCYIHELANGAADGELSIARARVGPGVTTAWHSLSGIDEQYVILSGKGKMELGESEPVAVGPRDVVNIPAGTRQRITNTGSEDLVFLCICSPGFRVDAYRSLE